MHMYLKPIINELATLERDGIEVQSPSVPHSFVTKAVLQEFFYLPANQLQSH